MALYDTFVARLKCWSCGLVSVPEIQTAALREPGLRDLAVGDRADLRPVSDRGAYSGDIVFKHPDTEGFCNFMMGWTCDTCKLVSWALVTVAEHMVHGIEPMKLDAISLARVHVLNWDKNLDDFLFRNRGMACSLNRDLELMCTCDRETGQVVPFFGLEDVVFETADPAESPATHAEMLRRVGPQVVLSEIREKMAVSTEQRSFGRYDLPTLARELANADREYRAHPEQFPRRLKVYGRNFHLP
jgi:hypothetical protein